MSIVLENAVIVITGASSGIGRATAIEFARQGAQLVLAARSKSNLHETADTCEELGAEVLVVPTDVSDKDQVNRLARRAVKEFGKIDVWVNNAGVGLYARFDEAPEDDYRQLIETNLFGCIYGARAAIAEFEKHGRGVLINVSSQLALGGGAYASAYAVSKYGVRALSDALRQEFRDTDIHICTVYPASTDTPFFQHAANYTGRAIKPLGRIEKPEKVAEAIVRLTQQPKPDTLIGTSGHLSEPLHWIAPEMHSRIMSKLVEKEHFQDKSESEHEGNLYRASQFADVHGGWKQGSSTGKVAGIASIAAAGASLWLLYRRGVIGGQSEAARDRRAA
jgi:short-subunit dehydrogenase